MGLVLSLLLSLTGGRALSQAASPTMSPSEAYKAAMAPLSAARAQPDDLTDADTFALGIGMAQASRDCLAISGDITAFAADAKELLALSELCIFGEQFEPARATLVRYLALPEPPERKLALVLLVRALLGLNVVGGARLQVDSLLHDYPYDAQIHFAIDQVINALEGANRLNGIDRFNNDRALQLCATQNAVTLPLLASGKALEGKDINASPSALFADAIRCAALAAQLGNASAQDTLRQLTAIAQQSSWAGTADLAPMQAALQRQMMVGARVPLASLHGHALTNSALVPRAISLTPFTLWSPSAGDVARALVKSAPQQSIYAITSWSANTGREDTPSKMILMALRLWQQTAPPHVFMIVVPDAELRAFHADSFPAGIAIRDGVVRSNSVLSSRGAERLLIQALMDNAERP